MCEKITPRQEQTNNALRTFAKRYRNKTQRPRSPVMGGNGETYKAWLIATEELSESRKELAEAMAQEGLFLSRDHIFPSPASAALTGTLDDVRSYIRQARGHRDYPVDPEEVAYLVQQLGGAAKVAQLLFKTRQTVHGWCTGKAKADWAAVDRMRQWVEEIEA